MSLSEKMDEILREQHGLSKQIQKLNERVNALVEKNWGRSEGSQAAKQKMEQMAKMISNLKEMPGIKGTPFEAFFNFGSIMGGKNGE